jgi:hypothetical protein
MKRWYEDLLDVNDECLPVDRPIQSEGRVNTIESDGRQHGRCFPVAGWS